MRDWYLFRDPDRYAKDLLEARGQDDYVVDVKCRRVLRSERFKRRLRHPLRAYKRLVSLAWKFRRWPKLKKSVVEETGERVATDPEAHLRENKNAAV